MGSVWKDKEGNDTGGGRFLVKGESALGDA